MSPERSKILVVEDDPDLQLLFQKTLETDGYEVVTAADGLAALDRLAEGPLPQLVFLDIRMPRMNGWEFLERIRADARTEALRVVVLSSYVGTVASAKVLAYLKKPAALDEILRMARTHVRPA